MTRKVSYSILAIITFTILIEVILIQSRKNQDPRSKAAETVQVTESNLSTDLCSSATISGKTLSKDNPLTVASTAKRPNIKYFIYAFSNKENTAPDKSKTPMFIRFSPLKPFVIGQGSNNSSSNTLTLYHSYFDKFDLSWSMKKPKSIQVNVYLEDDQGIKSQTNRNCEVSFEVL